MTTASEKARADQIALNATNQALSERIAADAIARHNPSQTDRAIADRINRGGLCQVRDGRTGSADLKPMHNDPGAPANPGPAAELVAVPRDEFEALAKAAVQGRENTAFLIDLVNEGLAVSYPEPAF